VHGALCVSFSGNCYASSYMFNASGNRGKCKQLCRLPYELTFDNKTIASGYLLSAKDNNMINRLEDLEKAGVDSLKIEGRARRPFYVGAITKAYRNAVDGKEYNNEDIMLAFNRGFTEGYFNGNGNIISNIQNHVGVEIGIVEKFKKGRKFNEIYFSSNREISPKSTLKFFKNENETATISAFDLKPTSTGYVLTTTQEVEENSQVYLIADFKKESENLQKINKKPIKICIKAKNNEKIYAKTEIDGKIIELFGDVLEESKSSPLSKEELENNFNKNEYFKAEIDAELGNVFILKKQLNEFRRKFFEQVILELTRVEREQLKSVEIEVRKACPLTDIKFVENPISSEKEITIYSPSEYSVENIQKFICECEKANSKPVLNLPNFATKQDIEMLNDIINKTKIAILVNNLYALSFNTEKIIGGGMNMFNSYSANYLNLPFIKAEGEDSFFMPYMTLRHCPMKQHLGGNCLNCPFKQGYKYKMQNGNIMKLKRTKLNSCTFYLTD